VGYERFSTRSSLYGFLDTFLHYLFSYGGHYCHKYYHFQTFRNDLDANKEKLISFIKQKNKKTKK